jgi:drug/metabolite transporter superfamily protein YnfA
MSSSASFRLGPLLIFLAAAVLEVSGDAVVRAGMRGRGLAIIGLGCALLGAYGVVVNRLDLDFSRLLGTYVAIFAVTSVVIGRVVFHDRVRTSTWLGVAVILVGGAIIHFGVGD